MIYFIIFHIISIFIFYIKQLNKLIETIKKIIFIINNLNDFKKTGTKNIGFEKNNKRNKKNNNSKDVLNISYSKNYIKKNKNKTKISVKNLNADNKIFFNNINITTNAIPGKSNNNNKKLKILKDNQRKKIISATKRMHYEDYEINDLSYNLALIYDKRTYCQYYGSLLKANHNLIFSFCNNTDYNSKIIKIDLFFIGFAIDYAVNAVFFDDEPMHQIYVSKGSFDFETQIPIAFYSFFISMILNTPLSFLALSNDSIISFKKSEVRRGIIKRGNKLRFFLEIKLLLFFILSFMFLLFFWYYISMFGVIYKNTQYHLLKDTLISFVISLLYEFVKYLLPGFFRIPALLNPKKKRKCLYKFSKILQSL